MIRARFLAGFLLLLSPQGISAFDATPPQMTISASGTIWKPADELQMKIGVITLESTAEAALAENSRNMRSITEQLELLGLEKEDYETSQFSINPTYTPYPQNPPRDWKRSIIGYEVTNAIVIHTEKLDLIGKVIDAANKAGANSISDLRFGLRSSRKYWQEALNVAASNAVSDARAIAEATGVQLVRVLSITLNQTRVQGPQLNSICFAKEMQMDSAPPIEPGDVAIEANITLIYEIH